MKRIHIKIFVMLSIILWHSSVLSEAGSVSLESKVDKAKITIGDRIIYSIIVIRDPNMDIKMPEYGVNLGMFEILNYNDPEPTTVDGKTVQIREYIISTFDVGEYEIPPVSVYFSVVGDTVWQELKTEKIKIEVESLKPSEAGDIRGIKPPMELKRDIRNLIRLIAIGGVILIIAVLTYLFIKRRKEGKGILTRRLKPSRPAHEIALEALDQLVNSELMQQEGIKSFYIRLSEIIRQYIEDRFYIVALEMTTAQLIENMHDTTIDHHVIELTAQFLEASDLVKFAKYVPDEQENQIAIQQAYNIVHTTKIILTEAEKSEAAHESPTTNDAENQPDGVVSEAPQTEATVKEEN